MQLDSVYLTIGYHQLEGKRVPLKKPSAILDSLNNQSGPDHAQERVMKARSTHCHSH